jgi:ankyrin repeat protein
MWPVCLRRALAVVGLLLTDSQLMKQLLADPNFPPNKPVQMPNGTIYIPLHVAIMARNTAAEKLLLEAGAAPTSVYTCSAQAAVSATERAADAIV